MTLKAPEYDQLRMLDLQAMDLRLDQIRHRRSTLPEVGEISALERRIGGVRDLLIAARTEHSDVERQRLKADGDVEQVRGRARRDQERLDSGSVGSPRELESLQSEIASLARRQSELEDVELEILQRLEDIDSRIGELGKELAALESQRGSLVARRDDALADLQAQEAAALAQREELAAGLDPTLGTLYERVRSQQGGIGAAELRQKRCGGCRMELTSVELSEVRAARADEVLRHDDCGRILVRTSQSGI